MPLSSAERCRKYREKLKETNLQKYEDMKKKNAERTKAKKIKIQDMDENKKQETRKKWRDAKRKKKQPIEDNPELVEEREVEKNMNMSPCAMEAQESHREMDNYEKSSHASEEACEEDSIDSEDEPATDSISSDEQENKELSQQNTFITNKQIKEHEEIKYDTETFKSEENIVPPETHKKEFVDTHAIDNSECSESTEIETEYGIILSEPFSAGSCMAQMKDNGQTIKKRVAIINKVFKDDGSGVLKLRNISSRVNVDPKTPFIQNGSTNETIADEFDTFGKHVASQLRQLSTESYLLAQGELQNVLSKYRLRDLKNL